jgi:hypothetical protein
MLKTSSVLAACFLAVTLSTASGQDYSVEVIDAAPDADEVSDEVAKQLADTGYRVNRGSRTVSEIWLCKQWPLEPDFKPTEERLYPFTPGQLIGLLHFGRRGSEFRDQSISSGWYTLRFGLQPVDGNHEGTSPTRDFLLLVDAEQDEFPETWKVEDLLETSAEAAGSTHPAMICLQRAQDSSEHAIRHDQSNDWWILHLVGKGVVKDKAQDVPVDLIVVGHATE